MLTLEMLLEAILSLGNVVTEGQAYFAEIINSMGLELDSMYIFQDVVIGELTRLGSSINTLYLCTMFNTLVLIGIVVYLGFFNKKNGRN
jgi:hypothetical protein